jgi:dTMP kinase
MQRRFITFEGGEGSGKSTQARRLARRLSDAGLPVLTTREPGGTEMAERIRALLVTGDPQALSSTAEALLNYAARDDHLRRVIRPALREGRVVISDRFADSTRAYQVLAGDCPAPLVDALERHVVGEAMPGLTFIMDIDPAVGLARARNRTRKGDDAVTEAEARDATSPREGLQRKSAVEDRFERFGLAFHERLRNAYLEIARAHPERCVIVDAARPPDLVEAEIWEHVRRHLGL